MTADATLTAGEALAMLPELTAAMLAGERPSSALARVIDDDVDVRFLSTAHRWHEAALARCRRDVRCAESSTPQGGYVAACERHLFAVAIAECRELAGFSEPESMAAS